MKHISHCYLSTFQLAELGLSGQRFDPVPLSRRRAVEPVDDGTFIKPIKQSFMRNRRIMDSTARLIALLSGWSGDGRPIRTYLSTLAEKMGKSKRQIQRMLNDAKREGYLRTAFQKNRIGAVVGLIIYLRFDRIRKPSLEPKTTKERPVSKAPRAWTKKSTINPKHTYYSKGEGLEERLRQMALTMGIKYEKG